MTDNYDCFQFAFRDKFDYVAKQLEIATALDSSKISVPFSVVHLNNFWLFLPSTQHDDTHHMIITNVVSSLAHVFLSRIRMRVHYTRPQSINVIGIIEGHIGLNSRRLFNSISMQPDMFMKAPTYETMREDLRTGLWITT